MEFHGNLESEVMQLHEFLFEREEYEPSSKVKSISNALIKKTGINRGIKKKPNTNSNNTVGNSTVQNKTGANTTKK